MSVLGTGIVEFDLILCVGSTTVRPEVDSRQTKRVPSFYASLTQRFTKLSLVYFIVWFDNRQNGCNFHCLAASFKVDLGREDPTLEKYLRTFYFRMTSISVTETSDAEYTASIIEILDTRRCKTQERKHS